MRLPAPLCAPTTSNTRKCPDNSQKNVASAPCCGAEWQHLYRAGVFHPSSPLLLTGRGLAYILHRPARLFSSRATRMASKGFRPRP
jgi:hypothetical protein